MPIRFVCGSCDRSIDAKDDLAGRRVKCPDCGKAGMVPDDQADKRTLRKRDRNREDEKDDQPRGRGSNKRSKKGLIIGLSVGCGVLAAIVAAGVAVLLIVFLGSRDNPNATEENFDKIKKGMSLEEVEQILGKGEKVSYNAGNEALHAKPSKKPSTGDSNTYRWKNKSDTILLIIDPSREGPFKGVVLGWFVREQKGGNLNTKCSSPASCTALMTASSPSRCLTQATRQCGKGIRRKGYATPDGPESPSRNRVKIGSRRGWGNPSWTTRNSIGCLIQPGAMIGSIRSAANQPTVFTLAGCPTGARRW